MHLSHYTAICDMNQKLIKMGYFRSQINNTDYQEQNIKQFFKSHPLDSIALLN